MQPVVDRLSGGTVHGTFGPYRATSVIAAGGMGVVHRAEHVESGRVVALKVSNAQHEASVESIRREAYGLSQLRHPGVVRVLGHGTRDGLPWIAMELLEGTTLYQHFQAMWDDSQAAWVPRTTASSAPLVRTGTLVTEPLDEPISQDGDSMSPTRPPERPPAAAGHLTRALTIARRLCQTLQYLHGEGVVHRDLTPGNVLLQPGDLPVLIDFGIFHRFAGAEGRETLEVDRAAAGTVAYVAPEQLRGLAPDARTDLYALGCLLFEAVCGRPPFLARPDASVAMQHHTETPPLPSLLVDGVPPALDALIRRLLEKDPAARPGHADDVGRALESLGAESSPLLSEPRPRAYLYRPPFTGHAELLGALGSELERARRGGGRTVFLSGPSGGGKTRLLMELGRLARRSGLHVITAECVPAGASGSGAGSGGSLSAFRPFLQLVADRCRAGGSEMTRKLLGAHTRVLAEHEPSLLGVPGSEGHPAPVALSPRDAGERAQRAVIEVLSAWAEQTPTLLAIDDLQWADDLSLGALSLLGRDPPEALSALVLVTCRSEAPPAEIKALRGAPHVVSLPVPPLGAPEVERIAAGMTAMAKLPPALSGFLAEQSGGSPLFVSEYLKAAVAEGILVRREGLWGLSGEDPGGRALAGDSGLAALRGLGSVETLIARRLSGLDREARAFLEAFAVWGRACAEADAAEVASLDDDSSLAAAETLLLRQILMETEEGDLRFVHDRLRETMYAAISPADRRHLHGRVAEALEARGHDLSEDAAVCRALALHHERAEAPGKAFRYAARGGRQALAAGEFRKAAEDLQGALRLAAAPGSGVTLSPLERGGLCRSLADALYAAGDMEGLRLHAENGIHALGVFELPEGERGWALRALEDIAAKAAAGVLGAGRRRDGGERRERVAETGYLLSRLAEPYLYTDRRLGFLGAHLAASRLAAEAGDSATLAWVDVTLGVALSPLRLTSLAERFLSSSRRHARRSSSLDVELYQAQVEGYYWSLQGDWDRATGTLDAAAARARDAGATYRMEHILIIRSMAHSLAGRFERGAADAREVRASSRAHAHALCEAFSEMLLGLALVGAGAVEDATEALRAATALLDKPHLQVQRANCHAGLARCHLVRGDLDGALREVAVVDRLVPALAPSNVVARAIFHWVPWVHLAAWANAATRGVRTDELERRAAAAVALASRHAFHTPTAGPSALRQSAEVQRLRGQLRRARDLARKSVERARELHMPHEEAWAHRDLARLDEPDRERHLAAARRLFSEIGCPALVAIIDEAP